jgi:hypothetical protein
MKIFHSEINKRINLLRAQKDNKELPLSTIAEFLEVNRTSAYYKSNNHSETELAIKVLKSFINQFTGTAEIYMLSRLYPM